MDGGASFEALFPGFGLLTLSRLGLSEVTSGVGIGDLLQLPAAVMVLLAVLLMLDEDAVLLGGANERECVVCELSFSSQSSVGLAMLRILLLLLLLRTSFVFVVILDVDFFSAILETFLVETAILPAEKVDDEDDDEDDVDGRDEKETADGITSEQFSSEVVLISFRFRPGFDGSFILVLAWDGVVGTVGSPPAGRDRGFVPDEGAWRRDSIGEGQVSTSCPCLRNLSAAAAAVSLSENTRRSEEEEEDEEEEQLFGS